MVGRDLYLDLLKRTILGLVYEDVMAIPPLMERDKVKLIPFDSRVREAGRDWPTKAHSMIGLPRMNNIQTCVEDVLARGVPGDLIETGVWRGGACIFMRGILKAYGVLDRSIWVADSFGGLPAPTHPADARMKYHESPELVVDLQTVKHNFDLYGLGDDQVKYLPGWFKDTLPYGGPKQIAVLRLDGDMYESTVNALSALYDRISPGGYIIIDDLAIKPCLKAVIEFRRERKIVAPLQMVDHTGGYWKV